MSVLDDLKNQKKLFIRCPCCEEAFAASKAGLFDATRELPPEAKALLDEGYAGIAAEKEALKKRKAQLGKNVVTTKSVNIGKVVEKIASSLTGFPAQPRDFRAMLEPIDYVAFRGLSANGLVEAVDFVEVKSGGAKLSAEQRQIRDAVAAGKVEFGVETMGDGE